MSDWSELYAAFNPTRPEGSKTVEEIMEEYGQPATTVRRVLKKLGYNSALCHLDGHQKRVYWPKDK